MTPAPGRWLIALLVLTALATAAVEWLNWWLSSDGGHALFVRTGWALLRSFGFLVLIWQGAKGAGHRTGLGPLGGTASGRANIVGAGRIRVGGSILRGCPPTLLPFR